MKLFQMLMCGILLIGFSCTEELKPTPYTYTTIFTGEHSKTWKLKFLEITLNGEVKETFNVACAADDEYKFYANTEHTYEAHTGANKCNDPAEANVITDSWTFNNATATLTMLLPFFRTDSSIPFIVREAKKSKLEIEIFFTGENKESYRIHFESTSEN